MQPLAPPLFPQFGQPACRLPFSAPPARILTRTMIASSAAYSAFCDLYPWKGNYVACWREGSDHNLAMDGAIRIEASADFSTWTSLALLTAPTGTDMRDPHLSEMPDGRLLLNTLLYDGVTVQSASYLSADGVTWDGPHSIGDVGAWIWRARWHQGVGYGVGYSDPANGFLRLYATTDGVAWTAVSDPLTGNYPNETDLIWDGDTIRLLVRRDTGGAGFPTNSLLLSANPPYTAWTTADLGKRIGSPCIARLADGRILVACRFLSPTRISLAWLDTGAGTLTEFLEVDRGDCGYPGQLARGLTALMVYYSDHNTKASIYTAQVGLPVA